MQAKTYSSKYLADQLFSCDSAECTNQNNNAGIPPRAGIDRGRHLELSTQDIIDHNASPDCSSFFDDGTAGDSSVQHACSLTGASVNAAPQQDATLPYLPSTGGFFGTNDPGETLDYRDGVIACGLEAKTDECQSAETLVYGDGGVVGGLEARIGECHSAGTGACLSAETLVYEPFVEFSSVPEIGDTVPYEVICNSCDQGGQTRAGASRETSITSIESVEAPPMLGAARKATPTRNPKRAVTSGSISSSIATQPDQALTPDTWLVPLKKRRRMEMAAAQEHCPMVRTASHVSELVQPKRPHCLAGVSQQQMQRGCDANSGTAKAFFPATRRPPPKRQLTLAEAFESPKTQRRGQLLDSIVIC